MSAIEGLRANLQQLTAKLQADLKPALEAAALKLKTAVEEASVAASRASDTLSTQLEAWRGRLELMVPNAVDALHALADKYPAMQAPLARLEEKVPHLDVVLPLAAVLLAAALVAVAYGRLSGGRKGSKVETTSGRPDGKKKKKEKKAVAEEGNLHHAPRESAVPSGSGGGHQHLQMDAAALDALAERLYRVLKVEPFVVKGSREGDEKPPPMPGRGADASSAEGGGDGAVSPGVKKKERKEKKSGRHVDHKTSEVANAAGNHERSVDGSDGELKNSVHAAEADGEHTVAEDGHGKDSHEE